MAANDILINIRTLYDRLGLKNATDDIKASSKKLTGIARTKGLESIGRTLGFKKIANEAALYQKGLTSLSDVQNRLGINNARFSKKNSLGIRKQTLAVGKYNKEFKKLSGGMKKNTKDLLKLNKQGEIQMKKFRMEYLSTMFMGMQMFRLASSTIKALIQTFRMLDEKGTRPITKSLNRLEASFTFLKFSIMEALGPWIEKLSIWFASLAITLSDYPGLLEAIGKAVLLALPIGLIMWAASAMLLFLAGLDMILLRLGIMGGLVGAILPLLAIGLAIGFFISGWHMLSKDGTSVKEYASFAALAIGMSTAVGLLFSPVGGLIGFLIGIVIAPVGIAIDLFLEDPTAFIRDVLELFNKVMKLILLPFITIPEVVFGIKIVPDFDFTGGFLDKYEDQLVKERSDAGKNRWEEGVGSSEVEAWMNKELAEGGLLRDTENVTTGLQDFETILGTLNTDSVALNESFAELGPILETLDADSAALNESFAKLGPTVTEQLPQMNELKLTTENINSTMENTLTLWDEWKVPTKIAIIHVIYKYSGGPEGPGTEAVPDDYGASA